MTTRSPLPVIVARIALALVAVGALASAVALGWFAPEAAAGGAEYGCPMHPQIATHAPGDCPICGMALEQNARRGAPIAAETSGGASALAADAPAFGMAPSEATRFVSYGRGPVQRRLIRDPLDAPAWVSDAEVVSALVYDDELDGLTAAGAARFQATSASELPRAVHLLARPRARWDALRWRVAFHLDAASTPLPTGSAGRVTLELAPREVLSVLAASILPSADGPAVLVVSLDRLTFTRRRIELGRTLGGYTIVRSGLSAGEMIVVTNPFFLEAERRLQGSAERPVRQVAR
jgi:Heavy metal binding domain